MTRRRKRSSQDQQRQDHFVLAVLEQLDQIATLWREGELHLFFLSDRSYELVEISHPFVRRLAKFCHWIGIRTNTTVFRDVMGRSLSRLNPQTNASSPKEKQWQMESMEQLSPEEAGHYQQLLALPLSLINRPAGAFDLPDLPLPQEGAVMIGELLLGIQQSLADRSLSDS